MPGDKMVSMKIAAVSSLEQDMVTIVTFLTTTVYHDGGWYCTNLIRLRDHGEAGRGNNHHDTTSSQTLQGLFILLSIK